jgi:hypothetical protein
MNLHSKYRCVQDNAEHDEIVKGISRHYLHEVLARGRKLVQIRLNEEPLLQEHRLLPSNPFALGSSHQNTGAFDVKLFFVFADDDTNAQIQDKERADKDKCDKDRAASERPAITHRLLHFAYTIHSGIHHVYPAFSCRNLKQGHPTHEDVVKVLSKICPATTLLNAQG